MKKKIIWLVVIFLLLVPFRLPIGVLFIQLTSYLADLAGNLSHKVLAANVVVTKLIYNGILVTISVFKIEKLSIYIKGRPADDGMTYSTSKVIYWWTGIIAAVLAMYAIFDVVMTYDLYYEIQNIPKP